MDSRVALTIFSACACSFGTASAQGLVYSWPVTGVTRAAYVGDVDQDGYGDILVATVGSSSIGRVAVRSLRLGTELYAVQGANPQDGFGSEVIGLGDVDQDGIADFAVSAIWAYPSQPAQPGYVRAYSGATGAILWQRAATSIDLQYGVSLARIGDLDQDGADDLVVGSPASIAGVIGRVEILSGASGAILRDFAATPGITGGFGRRVARALDLDQDGVEDVLVTDGGTTSQRVRILSGATSAVLRSFAEPVALSSFGESTTALADVDGDGVPDYVLGARTELYANGYGSGRVRIHSGASGALLLQLEGAPNQGSFGDLLDRFPDLDGDGREDILLGGGVYRIGCCTQTIAEMRVVSSSTGATLLFGTGQSNRWATAIPDVNGDGTADYLLPAVYVPDGIRGAVAITGFPPPAPVVGCFAKISSQGCRPAMAVAGSASLTIGDDLALMARLVVPNTLGIFVWSTAGASVPFAGGTLCVAAPIRRFPRVLSSTGVLDGCGSTPTGRMTRIVTRPELAAMGLPAGSTFFVQGWFRDSGFAAPNDAGLTDSVSVVLWP